MAGPAPTDFQFPNSSFFNIYNDAAVITANLPALPGGQCNYIDLSHGANGRKCGCRRFWSRGAMSTPTRATPTGFHPGPAPGYEDQTAWCMCSHHACYHDDVRESQTPIQTPVQMLPVAAPPIDTNGQENERPRTNREPLTPVVPDLSLKLPYSLGQPEGFYTFTDNGAFRPTPALEGAVAEPDVIAEPSREPSIPDTLDWANLVQSTPDQSFSLPPIPSQCMMPSQSQPSSTTSSARIRYLKPFGGKGLQTLSGVKPKTLEPPQENRLNAAPVDEDATETETDQSVVDDGLTVTNTPRSTKYVIASQRQRETSDTGGSHEAFHLLSNTVNGHEQRIENLESISFSAAAHDLCHDKHDNADLRVTELESRVEEVEKMLNDSASVASGHNRSRHHGADDRSVVSVSTSSGSYIMDRAELYSELQDLRAQLSQLQGLSSFPSLKHPWEVEVIFLPFPLKNVWSEAREFSSQRLSGSGALDIDPWTQLPNSSSPIEPQSPNLNEWVGPEAEADWLLGRACSSDNMIGQRLKSRGLVKNVSVCGPDARSVAQAITDAFGTLFRTFSRMQGNVHHGSTVHDRMTQFLGLQSPFVPLRKMHKDSRLRFLTPPEMITPVAWTVQFLSSSVVMKSNGKHRLFITHPEAYLQDYEAYEHGWTWQRLRELSRVYADSQSSQEVPEGDAKEECWTWNAVLDEQAPTIPIPRAAMQINTMQPPPIDVQQSAQPDWRGMTSSSQDIYVDARATTPSIPTQRSSRVRSPALRERRSSKPPHIRTTSVPPPLQTLSSPGPVKRRVISYAHPYERRSSTQPQRSALTVAQMAGLSKRRTRSPSIRSRLNRYTPRWSTASPSPMPEAFAARATTPFYATPYSNAPFVDTRLNHEEPIIADEEDDIDFDYNESGSDIDVYNDNDESMSEEQDDDDNSSMVDLGTPYHMQQDSWQDGQGPNLPEDEPWPGIEDEENHDPDADSGVEVNVHVDADAMVDDEGGDAPTPDGFQIDHDAQSQGSSVPSEYPSNEPPWITSGRSQEFRLHEDQRRSR
ncbi:hypothetical protein GGR57DRAFT_74322 [Xylariaceae sp. FL1272]|nr:hypothetical protein GGR57DRAFT_74322 [Xylariaceae sp. FL1272]